MDNQNDRWGLQLFEGGIPIPQSPPAAFTPKPSACRTELPPHPSDQPLHGSLLHSLHFLRHHHQEGGLGLVHSGGAFPGTVSPGSFWNFQRATGRRHRTPVHPYPQGPTDLSAPGTVPGNSTISLLPPRLQESETQAPPPWLGRRKPESVQTGRLNSSDLGGGTPALSHRPSESAPPAPPTGKLRV